MKLLTAAVINQLEKSPLTLLSELESVRGRFGLKIERDMHFEGMVLDKSNNEVRRAS